MATPFEPTLFDYGIHNEASQIRAHVCVMVARLVVFPTREALRVMERFPQKPAFTSGIDDGPTAIGHVVPVKAISHLRSIAISPERLRGFHRHLSPSVKGDRAVEIVKAAMKEGRFPIWIEGEYVTEKEIQVEGFDLEIRGKWRVEIKCDFDGGEPRPPGTGNLFLQIRERNPFKFK